MDSSHAMERGPSGWLKQRRVRLSAWIAATEGVVVLFSHNVSKWTVIGLAAISVLVWLGGRESRSSVVRNILWVFAASQLLAVILVVLAWLVKWALILAIVVLAVGGLIYLFADRR